MIDGEIPVSELIFSIFFSMTTILDELRSKITIIDMRLLELLEERMEISKEIAHYKKEQGLPVFDPKREEELLLLYQKKVDFQV